MWASRRIFGTDRRAVHEGPARPRSRRREWGRQRLNAAGSRGAVRVAPAWTGTRPPARLDVSCLLQSYLCPTKTRAWKMPRFNVASSYAAIGCVKPYPKKMREWYRWRIFLASGLVEYHRVRAYHGPQTGQDGGLGLLVGSAVSASGPTRPEELPDFSAFKPVWSGWSGSLL